jgi:uncharacterized protein (DUF2062 family)
MVPLLREPRFPMPERAPRWRWPTLAARQKKSISGDLAGLFLETPDSSDRPATTSNGRRASHLSVLVPESVREFIRCRILRPLLRQLRGGVTPRRLAWSLALGVVIGINPTVGVTTVLVVMLAWAFGLNQVASQVGAHAVSPLHLLLFIPFIELGVHLFHTRRLPLNRRQIEHLSHHPLRLIRDIWQWEWHALIVWAIVAAILMPLLAMYIRRALVLLMRRHRTLVRSRPALH